MDIKEYRITYNLSQKQVASLLGVTAACISNWETGRTRPNSDSKKKIRNILNDDEKGNKMNATTIKVNNNTIEVISSNLDIEDIHNKKEWSSLELVEVINYFRRIDRKKNDLRHDNLLNIIRDEFSEEINALNFQVVKYRDKKGEFRTMYNLTSSQAKQVLVRESKAVRRAVIQMLELIEQEQQQNSYNNDVASTTLNTDEQNKLQLNIVRNTVNELARLLIKVDDLEEKTEIAYKISNIITLFQAKLPYTRKPYTL